ncbi:MAG: hypothetical protein KBS66_00350, partial [Eubacterium sp.]|nr:hypothetical protein [Candidatus Colimonas fimequi]
IEYLIEPAKVTLTMSTVFYNKDTGEVKIAYVPSASGESNLRKNLVAFIGQLREEISDGNDEYLTETAKYIYYKNYYVKDIINKIAMFKRKIYAAEQLPSS